MQKVELWVMICSMCAVDECVSSIKKNNVAIIRMLCCINVCLYDLVNERR